MHVSLGQLAANSLILAALLLFPAADKKRVGKVFENVWTVKSEELITGFLRDRNGGCVSSSYTYTYRGK